MEPVVTPRPATMLWRGARAHCPMCGSGHLFRRGYLLRERCPRCGFRFERVEGHFIGAIAMNTIASFGLMAIAIVVGILLTYPDVPFLPVAVAAVGIALVVPLAFLPASRTLWTAVDLWMRPAEADEFVLVSGAPDTDLA